MDELLMKYIRGEASAAEREQVVRWIDADAAHERQYRQLRKLYDISLWNADEAGGRKRAVRLRVFFREALKVAAVLAIGFFAAQWLGVRMPEAAEMQTIFVPAGQRAELTLADGTRVWLNSRSTLRFPNRFERDARTVELDGEGFFDVARDEQAPFTVETERYDIQVLGTEFNVKAYKASDFFETSLLEGCVELRDANDKPLVRMKPNERVVAEHGTLQKELIPDMNYFRWREGLFCFDNETIGDLIQKLQLYYDVHIVVKKPSLMKYRYSGKFRIKDGVEHVLKVLQLKHAFRYQIDDETNTITIE